MDAAAMIMLAKIVSDIVIVIGMGMPAVTGMTDDEKKAMLASLQATTNKLVADLVAKANM